ncbi:glucuronate isomerase [Sporosarcina sp. 6E9]|uniref:glucuronate isomerase n=1 Tax=Sporosarcina sp. 6E9 TaxID=2819235 RepID=UPI001B301F7A
MKTFITDDFLLYNDTAKELYHGTAKDLPIIDYHNHLNQHEILADKNFTNLSEIWLGADHYKWRAMRANGVEESFITGDKSDYEKFLEWSKTVPKTFGNPLYHWTHLELKHYFGIEELLNEKSAPAIWEEANKKLSAKEMSIRSLLIKDQVEFLGTTDDPTDDLASHQALHDESFEITVSPSFRPDKGLNLERKEFIGWLEKLGKVTNSSIETYNQFLDALASRVEYFDEHGCRASDHGIDVMFFEAATKEAASTIFEKRLNGESLSSKEIEQYKTFTMLALAELYAEKGWAMQLHFSALRNNNTRMFNILGPDAGFDSIGNVLLANKVSNFLDALESENKLPKTILYSLNANDNNVLASMAGNYQSSEIAGKVQFGTAWWFNDTIDGMEEQMKMLANIGLISNFVGMLTDSRSFLSFPRHEYFRRILCNLLGTWVEERKVPKDMVLLEQYVCDICYENSKRYFGL